MAQFSLFKNTNRATQKNYPFLLDIQTNLLNDLRTTVVIPLMPGKLAASHAISKLNPEVKVKNEHFILMTQNIAGIDRDNLKEEIGDLNHYRAEIFSAIDFVLSGI